jgi:DNA-binding transcriptional LysR family regulator
MLSALTLDQLRILVTIEKTGSFSAAGRELRRVQSAISKAVQSLESSQSVQLFDRTGKVPTMTEAGRVLARQARQVLHQADMFEKTANMIVAGVEPELTLAVDTIVPAAPLISSLEALQAAFPELGVALYTEGIRGAERRVRNRSATLGICVLLPSVRQDLQAHHLLSINLFPVVAPNHPLASETRPINRDVLSEYVQLILTDPIDHTGQSHGVVSTRVWRFVDLGKRLDFLLAGFGWATMPLHIVAPHIAAGRLVQLDVDDPGIRTVPFPIYVVYERSRPLGKAASWLAEDLRARPW